MSSAPNVRQTMFPYGMARNPDGSWTFFNRKYKTLGTISEEWSEWDDPQHKIRIKGLGPATLAKLSYTGEAKGDRIYLYNDATNPELSKKNMQDYLKRLEILLGLQGEIIR